MTATPVRRIETPTGLTFEFPPLPPGPGRNMVITMLAAGLVVTIVGGSVSIVAAGAEPFPGYGLYFALFGAAGAVVAAAATLPLVFRTTIHLDGHQLISVWHRGPIGWPRWMPMYLTGFVIREIGLYACAIGGRRHMTWGYPVEWVLPVARELGLRLGVPVTVEASARQ